MVLILTSNHLFQLLTVYDASKLFLFCRLMTPRSIYLRQLARGAALCCKSELFAFNEVLERNNVFSIYSVVPFNEARHLFVLKKKFQITIESENTPKKLITLKLQEVR